ncbi:hypothetical protein [Klebsiella pneumoniae]|uniref:hypothetical protein n=1 Tax=Klebsiella pneumoniae TaxID=573 RepID=UPI000F62B1B5|nr:hypothetical protein [Klebsiella pneumoniae]RRF57837.1 hypothetical protein EAO26_27400 [Klebsiella pneumoniae]
MAEYQLSFDGFVRLFFAMAIIICGYGYIVMSIFVKDTLTHILMLLGLVGFSAFFSFVVFKDKSMWSGSPDLTLSVITGFYGHSDLYMFYVLIYSFVGWGR